MPVIPDNRISTLKERPSFGTMRRGLRRFGPRAGKHDMRVGRNTKNIFPKDDIQKAINGLNRIGGGILYLADGTYKPTSDVIGTSNIQFIGENETTTIIDFGSASVNFSFTGTDIYTTGTITSVSFGVNVVGSGTSWLANITTDHQIFIAQRWYKIAVITDDTNLVLAEGFQGGASFPNVAYRAVKIKKDIEFNELTIKSSTTTALAFTDCRNIIMENVSLISNDKGIVFTQVSEIATDAILIVSSTSDGITFDDCGLCDIESTATISNGGHGYVFNDCRTMTISIMASEANTADGVSVTGSSVITFITISASLNGGQGFEIVSTSFDIFLVNVFADGNTSDGLKLTATADRVIITGGTFTDNGGYGINIAASTCDDTNITGALFSGNTSGAINDVGVGLNSIGNSGLSPLEIKEHVRMKNTSGAGVAAGDIATYKAVAAGDELTTTTNQGDDLIFAMAVETIANDAYGRFQTLGKTTVMKVDGTTDIAIGDFIGTFTTAKIGQKAASGDMAIAVALEAYITNDSSGVIDALIIKPRKI